MNRSPDTSGDRLGTARVGTARLGTVAGVLLAAGSGSRLGRPKALVRFGSSLLVERGHALLSSAGCEPVVVVLGAAAEKVRAVADLDGAQVQVNPDWATGMGSSLRVALAALGPFVPAAVVALADQPLVRPAAVLRLVAAWRDGALAAVATYGGFARNPVLLDRCTWPEVSRTAVGELGARPFLRDHPELVRLVACDDTGSPDDLDTEEDLTRLEDRCS